MPNSPIVLLMTGTVNPLACPDAKFSPQERAGQYLRAFKYNLGLLRKGIFDRLVFAENSGWDLAEFSNCLSDEEKGHVELLSFPASEFDSSKGKSYNEILLIDKTLEKSQLIRDDDFFVKVTGRYSVVTLKSHVRDIAKRLPDLDCAYDVKDHTLFEKLGLKWSGHWSDSRVCGFRVSFYKQHIKGISPEFQPGGKWYTWEQQLLDLSRQFRRGPHCLFRFSLPVRIQGFNGGSYVQFLGLHLPQWYQPFHEKFFWYIKSVVRLMLPWIWM